MKTFNMQTSETNMNSPLPDVKPELQDEYEESDLPYLLDHDDLVDSFEFNDMVDYEEYLRNILWCQDDQEFETPKVNNCIPNLTHRSILDSTTSSPTQSTQAINDIHSNDESPSEMSAWQGPRGLIWEKMDIVAPGGGLHALINYGPCQISELVLQANPLRVYEIKNKLRSCLTEIYLGYLNAAANCGFIHGQERAQYKKDWLASPDWQKLGVSSSRPDIIALMSGAKRDHGRLNDYGSQDTGRSKIHGNHDGNQDTGRFQSHGYAYGYSNISNPLQDVSSISNALPTAPNTSKADEILMKLKNSTSNKGSAGTKRRSEALDLDDDYFKKQKTDFGFKQNDQTTYSGVTTPELAYVPTADTSLTGIDSPNGPSPPNGQQYAATASNLSSLLEEDQANMTDPKTSYHANNMANQYQLQPLASITKSYSSLEHLPAEKAASLWLDYNIPSLLDTHPPRTPRDPGAKDAVERARPYLLSIKTKLAVAQMLHGGDGRLARQLDSALKDVDTAWKCLAAVKADDDMEMPSAADPSTVVLVEQDDQSLDDARSSSSISSTRN